MLKIRLKSDRFKMFGLIIKMLAALKIKKVEKIEHSFFMNKVEFNCQSIHTTFFIQDSHNIIHHRRENKIPKLQKLGIGY